MTLFSLCGAIGRPNNIFFCNYRLKHAFSVMTDVKRQ
jgi:hypothetical protein